MEIVHRKLTKNEAQLLYDLIKKTPNITGYTIKELIDFSDVYIAQENNTLLGVCINKTLSFNWSEVAILYVLEKYRGNNIGRKLFEEAFNNLLQNNRDIYIVSRNPIVIKFMEEKKVFIVHKFYQLPVQIILSYITYSLNLYRIKEYIRKNFHKKLDNFVYGYTYHKQS